MSLLDHPDAQAILAEHTLYTLIGRVRSHLLVHAGGVARRGQGFILAADAANGKTTLVLELLRRGFSFLSDEMAALSRGEGDLRGEQPAPDVRGKTVILVDDGLATGSTMLAAAAALRQEQPARLVVGVPVAALETCDAVSGEVDEIVCVVTPEPFYAVGLWYEDFSQTTDEEVRTLLAQATGEHPPALRERGAA